MAGVMNVDEFEDYLDLQLSSVKKQCTARVSVVAVDRANVAIIGGGVVGCAIARAFGKVGRYLPPRSVAKARDGCELAQYVPAAALKARSFQPHVQRIDDVVAVLHVTVEGRINSRGRLVHGRL